MSLIAPKLESCFRAHLHGKRGTLVVSSRFVDDAGAERRRVWWVRDGDPKAVVDDVPSVSFAGEPDMGSGVTVTHIRIWPDGREKTFEVMREIPVEPGTTRMMFNQVEVSVPLGVGLGYSNKT